MAAVSPCRASFVQVPTSSCPATAALRCPAASLGYHAALSFHVRARSSSHAPSNSNGGSSSRGGRERQKAASTAVNSVSAAASVFISLPQGETCTTDTDDEENSGVTALGKLVVAEFAKTMSPRSRTVDVCDEDTETDEAGRESANLTGACEGGFCTYSDEKQEAWEREQEANKAPATPMLAGLAVATLDVTKSSMNVSPTPLISSAAAAVSVHKQEEDRKVHPDVQRRRQEREARKARRRGSSAMMSQKEWWTTSADNLLEVKSESAFSEAVDAAATQGKTVIVDYYAPWCQACARQFPEVVTAAVANPDILFLKVNAGNFRSMCEDHGVRRLPSYGVIEPGEKLWCTGFIQKLHDIMGKQGPDC